MSISLLKSAVTQKIISEDAYNSFLNSLNTVTQQFTKDAEKVKSENLKWTDFKEKYGHLRPDTYNILSECYKNNPEKFLRPLLKNQITHKKKRKSAWDSEKSRFLIR